MKTPKTTNQIYLKRCFALLTVVAIFVLADRILALVIQKAILQSSFRYSQLYRGEIDAEIVAMGNSRAIVSFNSPAVEEATSKRCFNLAYNGMLAYEHLALLQDLVKYNRKPKLVCLEASCLSEKPVPSNLRPYWVYSEGLSANAQQQLPIAFCFSQLTHLLRYNSEMTYRVLYFLRAKDQEYGNQAVIPAELLAKEQQDESPIRLEMPTEQNTLAIRELLRFAADNDIAVHVYLAPYLPCYRERIENLDAWITAYKSFIGETPFWDLSGSVSRSDHFADRIHTNLQAVPAITKEMKESGLFDFK